MRFSIIFIAAFSLFAAGCASPEAGRTRGGGPGADSGNRGSVLRVHEGARPFDNTPKKIPTKHPPLEPASQADQLSRR
ncbi:MAG: hypothetical protein FJ143_18480 [Deltaproteobacteria bacterium]|nr:hypothetical protein [Deltaproteobacteria bacterium]